MDDVKDILIRKEAKDEMDKKLRRMEVKMKESLSEMSRSKGGINILRYLLHTSGFLTPLTHMTATGVNKDVLLSNEAKRNMYLGLRQYMDVDTVRRIEWEEPGDKTEEGQNDQ